MLFDAFQDARAPVRNLPEIAIALRFEGDRCLGTQLRSGGGDFDDRGQSVSEVSVGEGAARSACILDGDGDQAMLILTSVCVS